MEMTQLRPVLAAEGGRRWPLAPEKVWASSTQHEQRRGTALESRREGKLGEQADEDNSFLLK